MHVVTQMKSCAVGTAAAVGISDFEFDSDNLSQATRAVISSTGYDVKITWDGTDPTSTVGHHVVKDSAVWAEVFGPRNIPQLKFIGISGEATVTITLER
jgi:hypothetical protein